MLIVAGIRRAAPVNRRGNDGPQAPSRDFIKSHVGNGRACLSSQNERGNSVLEVIFFFLLSFFLFLVFGHAADLCSRLQHQVRPLGGHLGLRELRFKALVFLFLFFFFSRKKNIYFEVAVLAKVTGEDVQISIAEAFRNSQMSVSNFCSRG